MDKPLFSVVIPTYNKAERIKDCLESLKNQTLKDFEVFVCDDGSIDNTADIVMEFSADLRLIYSNEPNWGGPARPRNRGISSAKADWICFLDSDDVWYPDKLKVVSQYLDQYDCIYSDMDVFDGKNFSRTMKGRQLGVDAFYDLMRKGNGIATSSMCVRKDLLLDTGGFAEEKDLIAVEDFDLWLRLALVNARFKHVPAVLGCYWTGGDNISLKNLVQINRIEAVYARHLPLLKGRSKDIASCFQAYLLARIYHHLGEFEKARVQYRIALGSPDLLHNWKFLFYAGMNFLKKR